MYIELLYVYNKGLLCCSFLLIFYYEFYYSFYYKAAENRGKQRITEDNGTFTEYREKAQKRYVSGLLKWLYHIIHENVVDVSEGPVSTGIISIFHCLKSPFTTFLLQFATRRLSLRSLYVSRPTRRRYPFSEYPGHG